MSDPIYLDHNATTPIREEVREAMAPFLHHQYGNPSSRHGLGRAAREAVEKARAQVAEYLGSAPDEIVFTSGGTESNNLALKGAVLARPNRGKRILTSPIEHPSVVAPLGWLERSLGYEVVELAVDEFGLIDLEAFEAALTSDTVMVTAMHAHNEVGTVQPLEEMAARLAGLGILLHSDGAQAVGKMPTSLPNIGVDLYTVAGHKMYAPKGVGALHVRRGLKLEPLLHGAGHERGLRAGTENTAGIVGLGAAFVALRRELAYLTEKLVALRDTLHALLLAGEPGLALNGHPRWRLCNTLNLSFPGCVAVALAEAASEAVAFSTGPACSDGSGEPTPFFKVTGLGAGRAGTSVRLALGRHNDLEQVRAAAAAILDTLRAQRAREPGSASVDLQGVGVGVGPVCPRCDGVQVLAEETPDGPVLHCSQEETCGHRYVLREILAMCP